METGILFLIISVVLVIMTTLAEVIIPEDPQIIPFGIATGVLIEGSRILLHVELGIVWLFYYIVLFVLSCIVGLVLSRLVKNHISRRRGYYQ